MRPLSRGRAAAMSTPNPTTNTAAGKPTLSGEAIHVIDSLEATLVAVAKHAATASPGATQAIVDFGNAALDKLEAWGVRLRGEIEDLRGEFQQALKTNTNTVNQQVNPTPSLTPASQVVSKDSVYGGVVTAPRTASVSRN